MKRSKFTESQIAFILRQVRKARRLVGLNAAELAMSEAEREALDRIVSQSELMLYAARGAGLDFIGYLTEQVLHEARAMLLGAGFEPRPVKPASGNSHDAVVVPIRLPKG